MKILFVTYETIDYACPRYRAFWPAKGLQLSGHDARVLLLDECSKKDIDGADVVVFERIVEAMAHEPDQYRRVQRARKIIQLWSYALLRKITGYDLDDYIYFSDDGFGFYNICTWLQKALIRYSTYVSTSSAFLASALGSSNPTVFQLANCIDAMSIREVPVTGDAGGRVTIGWLCGQTHRRDEQVMLDIIKPLIVAYGQAIRFLFVGTISAKTLSLLEPLSSHIKVENYCNWKALPALQKFIDINLVPLLPCDLNRGKSAISYLESGFLKIPSVCSRISEFSTIIKDGYNGYLADSVPEWLEKIGMLIEDAALRKEMGARAYRDVMSNHTVHTQGERYSSFLERMPLPAPGVRLKKSSAANATILMQWLKAVCLYLVSLLRERCTLIRGRITHAVKRRIKQEMLRMAAGRSCITPPSFQRNWHASGIEENIFQGLDAINRHRSTVRSNRRIVFEIRDVSLGKRIEPFITLANGIAEKGGEVVIVAPKGIMRQMKPYLNPSVLLRWKRPQPEGDEINLTQEECYAILKDSYRVVVDPYIFSPLVIDKRVGFRLGLYVGCRGDSLKYVGEICSYFKNRYKNMQLFIVGYLPERLPFIECSITAVAYEGPEGLAQLYSGIDAFIMLADDEVSLQMVLEAMSCGTPVISHPLDAKCLEDGCNILYFNPDREGSLCDCIEQVFEDHTRRERLINEGHNCAKQCNSSYMIAHFTESINEAMNDEDTLPVAVSQPIA